MVTRREIVGAGLAVAALSGAIGLNSAFGREAVKDHTGLPKAELPDVVAMMLDESLGISTALVDGLRRRKPGLPILAIRLDSFALNELKPLFKSARAIAGISSGATLFCLERIAWDHGYRITRRSEHAFGANAAVEDDATVLVLAEAIISGGPEAFAAPIATGRHVYRPSRADNTLHAWIMQTAVTARNV
jgi:hypothetical protein